MSDDQPDPALLQRAVDDRAAHPWQYYRLEHDDMKRMLDQLSQRAEAAAADRDRLIARVQQLIQEWRGKADSVREARDLDSPIESMTYVECATDLAAAILTE